MSPNPTVVIGLGQAGINVISTLHSIMPDDDEREWYCFIAIDSDGESLQNVPSDTTCFALSIDEDFVQQDCQEYPYLARTLSIPYRGTARQRPVGRYAVDNRGVPGFDTTFRKLREEITAHVSRHNTSPGSATGYFNIFLVNSLGGGTGSGAYPLLLAMLNDLKENLIQNYQINIYMSGIGIVPEVTFDVTAGHRDALSDAAAFLPNAYAALSDLEKLTALTANSDESVSIPIYSQMYGSGQDDFPQEIRLDNPPFDDYWLAGVNESEIADSSGDSTGFESYRESVNMQIARSIQAIGKCSTRRFPPGVGKRQFGNRGNRAYTGGFEQTEIKVPHERIKAFVELRADHTTIRNRLKEEIPERLDDLRDKRERLEMFKQDLDSASFIEDSSIWTDIQSHIKQQLGSPTTIDKHTDPHEIETLLDKVQETHDLEGVITALDVLGEKLHDSSGLSAAEESRAETIQELWKKYDMEVKHEYNDSPPKSLDKQADAVRELIRTKVEKYTGILESWDPTLFEEFQDAAPPVVDTLESDRERAEKELETLRNDLDQLDTAEADWNRVNKLQETINEYRTDIRYCIDDRITDVENEITELLDERDRCEAEVNNLTRRIESERERLAQSYVTERLAVLPIIPERLDQLDLDTTLDSLADYVDQGLIDREELRTGLNHRLESCRAFESGLMDRDFAKTEDTQNFPDVNETWILFAEVNSDLLELVNTTMQPNMCTSDDIWLEYLRDPYRIEFVSFTHRGPISAFTCYQQLEEMAEEGHLDAMAPQYGDYRYAFAYPEWYYGGVRHFSQTIMGPENLTIDRPPELNLECINKPSLSEGELKDFVKTTGLDSFLWHGKMWEDYECEGDFTGWKDEFRQKNLMFTDLQRASPEPSLIARWLTGRADWEEILTAVQENIRDRGDFEVNIE